jgi:flagellar motor switch/type III secretory pathway protein FliN
MPALVTTDREVTPEAAEDVWSEAAWLPCTLSVDLSLCRFSVRDLLQLEVGAILETNHVNGSDVRVVVNTQLVAWAEFDVVAQRVAVRITELA